MEKVKEAHIALISFLLTDGVGYKTVRKIISNYSHPLEVYNDSKSYLKINSYKKLDKKNLDKAYAIYKELEKNKIKILSLYEHKLPEIFEKYDFLPYILFVKGDEKLLNIKSVGIVGTRRNSLYGSRIVRRLVKELVSNNIVIVSGLAEGIDTVAHKSALEYGGKTIAVIGSGFNYKYPASNYKLYEEIEEKGLLVSEFLPSVKPSAGNFPLRNNTLAALSYVVVVAESYEKGGALITADAAKKLNKKVFAIPGNLEQESYLGCNRLIAERKADMIVSIPEFVKFLHPEYNIKELALFDTGKKLTNFPEKYQKIIKIFEENYNEPLHVEYLAIKLNIPVSKLLGILLEMECSGIISSLPGNFYKLT